MVSQWWRTGGSSSGSSSSSSSSSSSLKEALVEHVGVKPVTDW